MAGVYTPTHPLHLETQADIMRLMSSIYVRHLVAGPRKFFFSNVKHGDK